MKISEQKLYFFIFMHYIYKYRYNDTCNIGEL